jgi:hypothetical protein
MSGFESSFSRLVQTRPHSFLEDGTEYLGHHPDVLDLGLDAAQLTLDLLVPTLQFRPDLELFDLGYMASKNEDPFLECVATFFRSKLGQGKADKTNFFAVESELSLVYERIALAYCEVGEVLLISKSFRKTNSNFFHLSRSTFEYVTDDKLNGDVPVNTKVLLIEGSEPNFDSLIEWGLSNPTLQIFVDESWVRLSSRQFVAVGGRIHGLFSLHKYFGTNGLPLSVVFSADAEVLGLLKTALGSFRSSGYTQWLYRKILNPSLVDEIEGVFTERFAAAKNFASETLREGGLVLKPVEGSVFGVLDLEEFVKSAEDGVRFAKRALERWRVLIVPVADEFWSGSPGIFLVNLARPRDILAAGLAALLSAVEELKDLSHSC